MEETPGKTQKNDPHIAQVKYSGHQVSNAHTREVAQRIADYFGRDIRVSGGDRTWKTNQEVGGSATSLHLHANGGRAIDIHITGMTDRQAFDAIQATAHEIFDRDKAYEVAYHGKDTGTKGQHVHIGYYPMTPPRGYVDFKMERPPQERTRDHKYNIERVYLEGPTVARESPPQSMQDIRQGLIETYGRTSTPAPERERGNEIDRER